MAAILLVEDHLMNRKMTRDLLEPDFLVQEAASVEEAEDCLHKQRPDLIMLDLSLPGMDGWTWLRQLKADPGTALIPVVAYSAHAFPEDIKRALSLGCADYITKPITDDFTTFTRRLARLISA